MLIVIFTLLLSQNSQSHRLHEKSQKHQVCPNIFCLLFYFIYLLAFFFFKKLSCRKRPPTGMECGARRQRRALLLQRPGANVMGEAGDNFFFFKALFSGKKFSISLIFLISSVAMDQVKINRNEAASEAGQGEPFISYFNNNFHNFINFFFGSPTAHRPQSLDAGKQLQN